MGDNFLTFDNVGKVLTGVLQDLEQRLHVLRRVPGNGSVEAGHDIGVPT
jgi:hypothetical protein